MRPPSLLPHPPSVLSCFLSLLDTGVTETPPWRYRSLRRYPLAAMPKMNARAKALDEKLRNLKERAKAAREATGEAARQQFNRDLDNKPRSVPQPSASSDASSHVKPDEPLRSPTEPIASPAPISQDAPIAHQSNASAMTNLRERLGELVRAMLPVVKHSLATRSRQK